ncbi:MAG: urate hydroxylase PuuD [Myxococcota bacterium]|nr:urate hydroxylase PuuD [Myxococcota bacterium]
MSDPWLTDWLHLLARWFHLIVGAAWIGTSFYFNWLNNNVRPVAVKDNPDGRLAGALWSVHGGAFYRVQKFKGAPEQLPDTLHWFKWEAYLTWISGVSLLVLVYWFRADTMMVAEGSTLSAGVTAAIGVGSLVVGWVVYDLLCRSPLARAPAMFAAVGFLLMTGAAYGLSQVFSARAAYIHVGAMMGTMMALNVFFVIIPGQRAMVDAMTRGEEPDVSKGAAGSLRSLHNNYLTLPVLFIMISNHFPFTYGHESGWVLLAALALIGAGVRHWFNLSGRGERNVWILPVAAVAMSALAFVSHGPSPPAETAEVPAFAEVQGIVEARCVACHADAPSWPGMPANPNGVNLETASAIVRHAQAIKAQAVTAKVMPMGNVTKITAEERALLGAWVDAGAPTE